MVSISGRFFPNASPTGRFKPQQIEELKRTGKFLWFVRGRECWVDKEAMERRAAMDMVKVTERINAKKGGTIFVLIHGSADEIVPVEDAEEVYSRLGFPGAMGCMDVIHVAWNNCPAPG